MLYLSETTEQSPTDAKLTKKKKQEILSMFAFWNFGNHCIKASKKEKNKQTNPKTEKTTRF